MLLPVTVEAFSLGVLINIGRSSRKADHKHVVGAVSVKVVDPVEEVVRIASTFCGLGG